MSANHLTGWALILLTATLCALSVLAGRWTDAGLYMVVTAIALLITAAIPYDPR